MNRVMATKTFNSTSNIDLGDIGGFRNMDDINLADMMKGAFGCGSLISSYLTDVVNN